MKKIGFLNSIKSWGGGEKWYFEVALYFMNEGYEVHFFLAKNSELHKKLENHPAISLHFVSISGLSFINPFKIIQLKNIFIKYGIQVLFINQSHDLKTAGQAATKACVLKVIYTRGIAVPIKNSRLNRYIYSHWLTDILANSMATSATILQNNSHLFPKDKIKVIYNPLDVEEFCIRSFIPIYLRKSNEVIIGSLGRLETEKNHIFLIQLSELLLKKGINHKILIGGTGSLETKLKKSVNKKGLEEHFLFTGFISNVKDLLMNCDIFMLPSLWEGFGFVLAEASLCKKPIIAFNTSSIPELVDEGKTGFIIETNNVAACIDKILILNDNPARMTEMGENGCELVHQRFSKNIIMKQLENFINQ